MGGEFRVWHLVALAAGFAAGGWLLVPAVPPPAPNFTGQGFASVRVELRGLGGAGGRLATASDDPAVAAELADILRSGRSVVVCRCAALGSLKFRRPDGSGERVLLMPAHDEGSVEFRFGKGRYRVSREWFLRVVGPLGVPAARWYRFPDADPGAKADDGGI